MALIDCAECGAEISSRAVACPKCGAPCEGAAPRFDQTLRRGDRVSVLLSRKKKVNHLLHLALSVLTGGIWVIMWAGLALGAKLDNASIDREIEAEIKERRARG